MSTIKILLVTGADLEIPYSSSDTAEDVCLSLCKRLNFLPIAKSIFGLRIFDSVGTRKIWLALNSKLYRNHKYELRIRFKVSSLSQLFTIDQKVYDYYFHQARKDILNNDVSEINYAEHKNELLGLGVTDMCRDMIEQDLSAEELKRNYKKYTPREVVKKHSYYAKKLIHESLERIQRTKWDVWYIKNEYLKQLDKMAPNYLSEEYVATTDNGEGAQAVHLKLAPYHIEMPGLQISYENGKNWQHLCTIQDLCFVSMRTDCTVEISRKNGIPSYFKFQSIADMHSFVSLLDGYYRFTVKWTFNLCKELPTPSLKLLHDLKCHGPVGGQFSYAKLAEKRNNKHGCYAIRECEQFYDTYYIDACSQSGHPETFKVVVELGKWNLYIDPTSEIKTYSSLASLIAEHNDSSKRPYLIDCVPPSEYDRSPLLICEPKLSVDSKADVSDFQEILISPHCINPRDIQYFKSTAKETCNGMMCFYRAMWKAAPGKKMEVAMKVLKSEHTEDNLKEFIELCGKWAFVKNKALVRLYGVTLASPVSMVMEYLSLGALDEYLRKNPSRIEQVDMVEAGSQLATALWHLHENGLVHGRIRCSKLLVASHDGDSFTVRLSDPGLHITYTDADAHWIPPECYSNFKFANKTSVADVWAFATTLWEIFSLGAHLPEWNVGECKRFYMSGRRLPKPDSCSDDIYSLMKSCWNPDPHCRKQSQEIMRDMNQILYQVFNSRRKHSYSTVFPKCFKDMNGSRTSLFSTATDDTFLMRDLLSASDMERDSNKSITSDISAGSSQTGWDMKIQDGDDYDISTILSSLNLISSTSVDSMEAMQCIFELSADCNLVLQGRIGQGFYGEVYRGSLERDKDTEPQLVAVKKLKTNALNSSLQDFEREISIMKTLKHPNIVEILCVVDEPEISLVMEFVAHGSLQSYLKIHRATITLPQLLKYAIDVAQGMEYLGKKHIVHRDLAARNILVAGENLVKISDFGLAQVTGGKEDYYILKTNRDLPIKWYAPESLCDGKFSSRSDVWSYGVTMFEMFSYGEDPVLPTMKSDDDDDEDDRLLDFSSEMNSTQSLLNGNASDKDSQSIKEPPQHTMFHILQKGIRLGCPERCPSSIYTRLICPCWKFLPAERLTFAQLTLVAKELHQQW